jgi:hypothetical protein
MMCGSNSYAFVLENESRTGALANRHRTADQYFARHPEQVRRIPKPLSVQNRHLASQTALELKRTSLTKRELMHRYFAYRNLYGRIGCGPGMEWAEPCVRAMADLTGALAPR